MATPSSSSSVSLGPWTRGFQNFYDPTRAPADTLAAATNVLIEADGTIASHTGLDFGDDIHSKFTHNGRFYGVFRDTISEFFEGRHISLNFPVKAGVKWTVLEDEPLFYNRQVIGKISLTDGVTGLGGAYNASATPDAKANEDSFVHPYRDAAFSTKQSMPGGTYVRYWRSRLLVANDNLLFVSDPFMYGVYDRMSGIVKLPAKIDFLEAVDGGVFVALRELGVYFLAGTSPEDWQLKVADIICAQPMTSLLIPTAGMKLDVQNRPEWVAVWLTSKGFAIGLPNGSVIYPQADLLSGLPLGSTGSLSFEGDRLIALTQ